MRPPRYRFPDEVRSTTRVVASRMVQEGETARTPEELDAWISQRPDVRESLERGGYGTAFTADDLFPLFEVFVQKAGGSITAADAPPPAPRPRWLVPALLLLAFLTVLVLVAVMTGGFA